MLFMVGVVAESLVLYWNWSRDSRWNKALTLGYFLILMLAGKVGSERSVQVCSRMDLVGRIWKSGCTPSSFLKDLWSYLELPPLELCICCWRCSSETEGSSPWKKRYICKESVRFFCVFQKLCLSSSASRSRLWAFHNWRAVDGLMQ